MVCNVPVFCKDEGDRNQLGVWIDSDLIVEKKQQKKQLKSKKNKTRDNFNYKIFATLKISTGAYCTHISKLH